MWTARALPLDPAPHHRHNSTGIPFAVSSEFLTYFRLGVGHIADLRGYDHILFIVALTAGYAPRDWRRLLWLVTAFTLGHSATLALATLHLVRVDAPLIEFLIAATIVVAGGYSLLSRRRAEASGEPYRPERHALLYALAGAFGLIHGLGFSNFLRAMLGGEESIVLPLFAFNVGLEIGQLAIVAAVLLVGTLVCEVGGLARRRWVSALSFVIVLAGLKMMVERFPTSS
ncbi:MAG TPA: HupE/UreJ family protein [Gemmatimonadaceae bacterium]|nr:HupE/UreJ family protein [Gemmatimonadaceae bacterium]